MKHVRRSLILLAATATTLVASAGAAVGQQYPPTPGGDPGGGAAGRGGAGAGSLASTGSDLTLLWVGLAVLMIGLVAFVATRRRAASRGSLHQAMS